MAKKSKGNNEVELHWTEELEQLEDVSVHLNQQLYMHTPLVLVSPSMILGGCSRGGLSPPGFVTVRFV